LLALFPHTWHDSHTYKNLLFYVSKRKLKYPGSLKTAVTDVTCVEFAGKWLSHILLLLLLAFTTHLQVLASSVLRFTDHTQWNDTVGWTPLDEWSARRRDLYLTNTQHSQQTSMPPARFEPAIPAGERLQTHALDRSATGIGIFTLSEANKILKKIPPQQPIWGSHKYANKPL
jgi:hypothetical protein